MAISPASMDGAIARMAKRAGPQYNHNIMKTNHRLHAILICSMAVLSPVAYAESTTPEGKGAAETPVIQPGSITTVIADSTSFSTLTKALKAAELDAVLGGNDNYTIFAPTDEAFGKLPAETLAKLMLPENKEKLRMLLLYHVVAGKVLANDLATGEVKTANGAKVKVDVSSSGITVDGAKVYSADVMATNGAMHSIGEVLVPKSLDGFAGLKE